MEFEIEKLAKEILVEKLRAGGETAAVAGQIAREIAVPAVTSTRGKQDPHFTIAAACRGIMHGVVLAEKDLPAAAVAILEQMSVVANETNLDPAECMTWAMEGIAPACRMGPASAGDAVKFAIDEKFMGAGEVFGELLRTAGV